MNSTPATEIWHCDPLVVVHTEDGIVYARRTLVEFTPTTGREGFARAMSANDAGWAPEMTVTDFQDLPDSVMLPYKQRPGRTVFGFDEEGHSFVWHIDRAADIVLTEG